MFKKEDEGTIIRRNNVRRIALENGITNTLTQNIILIDSKDFFEKVNPYNLQEHEYKIPKLRCIKDCAREWNKHRKTGDRFIHTDEIRDFLKTDTTVFIIPVYSIISPAHLKAYFAIITAIISLMIAAATMVPDIIAARDELNDESVVVAIPVQSNVFVYVYLICAGLASFGVKCAKKVAYNPLVGAMATTYILVTGLVYTAGIPMGFTPPFQWGDSYHAMSSFIQVYFHMIIPPFMVILWFFPFTNKRINHKTVWFFAIYPFVYSIFSIIRGAVGDMHFYPYPFYRPEFIWSLFSKGAINYPLAYFLMFVVLVLGMLLFIGIGRLLILANDKMIDKQFCDVDVYKREICGSEN